MIRADLRVHHSRVCLFGLTFKENCPDTRNSKAFQIARDLLKYEVDLAVVDPWVDPEKLPQDLRDLHLQKNMGKAHGINLALAISHGEIIVTLDADSMLDEHAVEWAVWHFNIFPRVGAVTGNPRVRNRTTLLAKIQTAEYSSVIGLIKRAQRLMGKVMTVSGVVAAWRRSAVVHAGLWDTKAITDDIEMTWRLETKFWDVRYETNMLCWMLVPESLSGLWKQRCRWAQGGVEVMRRHYDVWKDWRQRRIWPIYVDYFLGTCWAYAFTIYLCAWLVMALCQLFTAGPAVLADLLGTSPFWGWNGAIVAAICLLQLFTSLCIDSRYEPGLWRLMIWVAWYPLAYWAFNSFATVAATPRGLFRNMDKAATWASPDSRFAAVLFSCYNILDGLCIKFSFSPL